MQLLVHELLHAIGFMSHPHDIHTSILSYRFDRSGIIDELPLIDQAMLWDMYGWGEWTGDIAEVFGAAGGVQYGARAIVTEAGCCLYGPFVDGGRLGPPLSDFLRGTASWTGGLTGYDAAGLVRGRAHLTANFTTNRGTAKFDRFQTGTLGDWVASTLHGGGYRYNLVYGRHWFHSTDTDPDVVGALYGAAADVAAGTIERHGQNWLRAGFGAEKN